MEDGCINVRRLARDYLNKGRFNPSTAALLAHKLAESVLGEADPCEWNEEDRERYVVDSDDATPRRHTLYGLGRERTPYENMHGTCRSSICEPELSPAGNLILRVCQENAPGEPSHQTEHVVMEREEATGFLLAVAAKLGYVHLQLDG